MSGFPASLVCALLVGAAACQQQVDSSYSGEPLATIGGSVTVSQGSGAPAVGEAALLWTSLESGPGVPGELRLVGVSVPVAGAFPARFEMQVVAPPPESAYLPLGKRVEGGFTLEPGNPGEVAFGFIVALAPGADKSDLRPRDLVGAATDKFIVYVKRPIAPGSIADQFLDENGGAKSPGYHLLDLALAPPAVRAASNACRWGGVCLRSHHGPSAPSLGLQCGSGPAGLRTQCGRGGGSRATTAQDEFRQEFADAQLAACVRDAARPPVICELWTSPTATPAQRRASNECLTLHLSHRGTECAPRATLAEAGGGFGAPVTITLGARPWDALL